jgi:hypothetical protein
MKNRRNFDKNFSFWFSVEIFVTGGLIGFNSLIPSELKNDDEILRA